tara:strand:+ start:422 stop:1543 length:1122 start_codon:yes stop_codon:yes gene_type:complete
MSYNILGINPFHNGSVCVLSDGEIVYFLEEERLTRKKQDANPFRVILDILTKYEINEVVVGGISQYDGFLNYTNEDPFISLINKHFSYSTHIHYSKISSKHHYSHLIHTYYNSGFKESLGIVIDGGGSIVKNENGEEIIEKDSIFLCTPNKTTLLHSSGNLLDKLDNPFPINIGIAYGIISQNLGFGWGEEGKLMGLSSYGKYNPNIPPLFIGEKTNPKLIWQDNSQFSPFINQRQHINLEKFPINFKYDWHTNSNFDIHFEKDLAWRIQFDTQKLVGDYIEKYIKKTNLKKVCCAGGYFLNCVANYYLTKRFPDVEFYFEPISHDGGTAIGAAFHRWKELNPNFKGKKQQTIYYGPQYSKEQLLEGIKKYVG